MGVSRKARITSSSDNFSLSKNTNKKKYFMPERIAKNVSTNAQIVEDHKFMKHLRACDVGPVNLHKLFSKVEIPYRGY